MFERNLGRSNVLATSSVLMAGGLLLSACNSGKEEAPLSSPMTSSSEAQTSYSASPSEPGRVWTSSREAIANKADEIISVANAFDTSKERQSYLIDYYCGIKEDFEASKRGNVEDALGYYGLQQAAVITAYSELADNAKVPEADIEILADEQCDLQTISSRPVHQG